MEAWAQRAAAGVGHRTQGADAVGHCDAGDAAVRFHSVPRSVGGRPRLSPDEERGERVEQLAA